MDHPQVTDIAEVTHALELEDSKKKHLSVVLIGHVDAGKSTTAGQILFLSGQVDDRTIKKYEKEARDNNRESWYMAYIMDTTDDEREKGITIEVGRANFETQTTRFTLLDAPGHRSFIPNMITGASEAEVAILVVSARRGEFETGFDNGGQTREHVILAKTLGVSKLVIVVNKMDDATVEWSKERYDEIETKMKPFLRSFGYNVRRDVQFLPISGLTGANINARVDEGVCPWWDGPCLFEALDAVEVPPRYPEGPFRFPITEKYKEMGDTVVTGKVESGSILRGDNSLLVMPSNTRVTVNAIHRDDDRDEVIRGGPGENLRVRLSGIGDAEVVPGSILCGGADPVRAVTEFTAQLQIVAAPESVLFAQGYQAVLHVRSAVEECEIVKMKHQIDPATGAPVRRRFAKEGDVVVCCIRVKVGVCVERFADFQQLGRFTIRAQGKTIAVGIVTELGA